MPHDHRLCLTAALTALLLAGCASTPGPSAEPESRHVPPAAQASGPDGLMLALDMGDQVLVRGQQLPLTIVAHNQGDRPITIRSRSATPYFVDVLLYNGVGWEKIARYPQASAMVLQEWTLKTDETRTFQPLLSIDESWPTYSPLKIRVMLNGVPEVAPEVLAEVVLPDGPKPASPVEPSDVPPVDVVPTPPPARPMELKPDRPDEPIERPTPIDNEKGMEA